MDAVVENQQVPRTLIKTEVWHFLWKGQHSKVQGWRRRRKPSTKWDVVMVTRQGSCKHLNLNCSFWERAVSCLIQRSAAPQVTWSALWFTEDLSRVHLTPPPPPPDWCSSETSLIIIVGVEPSPLAWPEPGALDWTGAVLFLQTLNSNKQR